LDLISPGTLNQEKKLNVPDCPQAVPTALFERCWEIPHAVEKLLHGLLSALRFQSNRQKKQILVITVR
jgi:hypothetical protein